MRIGIFGGTFDPIHVGHLVLAEQCLEQCELDEVWFVPAAVPPHKQGLMITDSKSRCDMVEFAISGNPRFKLSRIEVQRSGPSYTVTTLEQIQTEDTARELFLLIGADSLRDLLTWWQPQRILVLATVVAVNRGRDRAALPESPGDLLDHVKFVQMPGIEISASDIRQRVSQSRSIRYLVPRAVESYIHEHSLYAHE